MESEFDHVISFVLNFSLWWLPYYIAYDCFRDRVVCPISRTVICSVRAVLQKSVLVMGQIAPSVPGTVFCHKLVELQLARSSVQFYFIQKFSLEALSRSCLEKLSLEALVRSSREKLSLKTLLQMRICSKCRFDPANAYLKLSLKGLSSSSLEAIPFSLAS